MYADVAPKVFKNQNVPEIDDEALQASVISFREEKSE